MTEQELTALKLELATAGFSHGYEISFLGGVHVYGGASSMDEARSKRIAAEWDGIRAGSKPLGSSEFKIIKTATAPVALKAA